MKAQFADLPSGLVVPMDLARQHNSLSPALCAQPRPDVTIDSNALRNIGQGFMTARRSGAEIDVPEGARQVQMVFSDTMANVIGMSLVELAKRLDETQATLVEIVREAPPELTEADLHKQAAIVLGWEDGK